CAVQGSTVLVGLYGITDPDEGFILGETDELPRNAACLRIQRHAKAPHDVRAAASIKTRLPHQLNGNAGGCAVSFKVVLEIEILAFEARFPRWREKYDCHIEVVPNALELRNVTEQSSRELMFDRGADAYAAGSPQRPSPAQ